MDKKDFIQVANFTLHWISFSREASSKVKQIFMFQNNRLFNDVYVQIVLRSIKLNHLTVHAL